MRNEQSEKDPGGFWRSRYAVGLLAFGAIAAYFLLKEHRAHLAGALPYLPYVLFLACPLIHLFMHGGHENHEKPSAPRNAGNEKNGDGS